jgi:stage III sporulation protein SpoIIIAA
MIMITKTDHQYCINNNEQFSVFDSANFENENILILKRKEHFIGDCGNTFSKNVGISTLFNDMAKEAVEQLIKLDAKIIYKTNNALCD